LKQSNKLTSLLFLFLFFYLSFSPILAQIEMPKWKIPYGTAPGSLAVYNLKTHESFRESAPFGPQAFRVVADKLWVLNSIGNSLNQYSQDGKLLYSLELPKLSEGCVYSDFAFEPAKELKNVWVCNDAESTLHKISMETGKTLMQLGGTGEEPGKFIQISQIDCDDGGRLYVADEAKQTISVFSSFGELLRQIDFQGSRFALDNRGRLHSLYYSDKAGYFRKTFSPKGQLQRTIHIGLGAMTNARIEHVSKNGDLYVTFKPAGIYAGQRVLYVIRLDGTVAETLIFKAPVNVTRFISVSAEGSLFQTDADYFEAPDGTFNVFQLK